MNDQNTSAKDEFKNASAARREQLADIAEHIGVQLADLSELAEQSGMIELQKAIDQAIDEAGYFSLYD